MPMEMFWFAIVSVMLAIYTVLDGFDFGVGVIHRLVARTDDERRTVLAAIGPYWDGNEVWLLAAGGVLFFAFPRAYSAAFSGFYLALMIVLWLLVLRGISIEFRSHVDNTLWREFWDSTFTFASVLMAIVLGATMGNVVRGVPLDGTLNFAVPLFTANFSPGPHPGAFDWYTLLVGIMALFVLAGHGALYLTWKTSGPVHERSKAIAWQAWLGGVALWVVVTVATVVLQGNLFANLLERPVTWVLVLVMLAGLAGVFYFQLRGREGLAFLSSSLFIIGILAATMAGNFPNLLRSTIDPANSVTVYNASTGKTGLEAALMWWPIAMVLVAAYFLYLFWSFSGKLRPDQTHDSY